MGGGGVFFFFFFKQKTAYEISACLVGSEMCIRDRIEGKERKRSADIYMSAPRTFQWNITVNLPEGYKAAPEGVEKLNVKVENECGAFIAKAVTENGKLILNILKRYNHKIEPAANWEKLLQIQDASKAYEALSVVLKK